MKTTPPVPDIRELLPREMHHRFKNQLNIISSLLALKAGGLSDPEVSAAMLQARSQITALANLHDLLLRGPGRPVDCAEYMDALAEYMRDNLAPDRNITIQCRARTHTLEPNRLYLLGLAACELVTNALLHAYPDKTPGTISLELDMTGDTLVLAVEDQGVGLPQGFSLDKAMGGLDIVKGLAEQLGGVLGVEPAQGTRIALSVPA